MQFLLVEAQNTNIICLRTQQGILAMPMIYKGSASALKPH